MDHILFRLTREFFQNPNATEEGRRRSNLVLFQAVSATKLSINVSVQKYVQFLPKRS